MVERSIQQESRRT